MSGPKTTTYALTGAVTEALRLLEAVEAEAERRRLAEAARGAAQEEAERKRLAEAESVRLAEAARRAAQAHARAEAARQREESRQAALHEVRIMRRRLAMTREQIAQSLALQPAVAGKPSLPDLPEIDDESMKGLSAMREHLASIERRLAEVASLLNMSQALSSIDLAGFGEGQTVDQLLDSFIAARRRVSLPEESAAALSHTQRREVVDRILGKLRGGSVEELPASLESILQRALGVEGDARFDMLSTELTLHVQQHNTRTDQRLSDTRVASAWLERLSSLDVDSDFSDLGEALSDLVSGRQPWDAGFEDRCESALKTLQEAAQRRCDATAARILELTLRDLGYEVEGIQETLFTEGGTVFFQSQGWGDHHMRLRVLPDCDTMHFNMVRPADAAASRQVDQEMEQVWCSQYPKLMAALAARGVNTAPLRALRAGSLEVESVEPALLPKRVTKTARASISLSGEAKQARNKT